MLRLSSLSLCVYVFSSALAFAQSDPPTPKAFDTTQLDPNAQALYRSYNRLSGGLKSKMSALTSSAASAQAFGIQSVPTWSGAFAYQGQVYNYTMVGGAPQSGGVTKIHPVIIPISMEFQYYYDNHGKPLVLTPDVDLVTGSPNFQDSSYDSGYTQFGDAVQRAEFWSIQGDNWHTLLEKPSVRKAITVLVPYGFANITLLPNGTYLAKVDARVFDAQLDLIRELVPIKNNELPILLTKNVVEYEFGSLSNCCVIGYHGSEEKLGTTIGDAVQTYAWASFLDEGLFSGFLDVTALSHEISEWMNDPFVNNSTPFWNFPAGTNCQGNLETGDPIEVLPDPTYPVTLNGFTYHPQTEALFQWFARVTPSDAINGAYSFPDTSKLTSPSKACGAQ